MLCGSIGHALTGSGYTKTCRGPTFSAFVALTGSQMCQPSDIEAAVHVLCVRAAWLRLVSASVRGRSGHGAGWLDDSKRTICPTLELAAYD